MLIPNESDLMTFVNSKKPNPLNISVSQIKIIFKGKFTTIDTGNTFKIQSPHTCKVSLILSQDLTNFSIPYNTVTLSETGKSVRLSLVWKQLFDFIHVEDTECDFDVMLFKGTLLRCLNNTFGTKIIRLPMTGISIPETLQDIVGSSLAYSSEIKNFRKKIQERSDIIETFLNYN